MEKPHQQGRAVRAVRGFIVYGSVLLGAALAVEIPTELQHRAAKGDTNAQLELGLRLEATTGCAEQAKEWLVKAAEKGNAEAQFVAARRYWVETKPGELNPKPAAEAIRWYRAAADQGLLKAQFQLWSIYHQGYGVPVQKEEGLRWLFKAALAGHALAQSSLGYIYWEGDGVQRDPIEALAWMKLSGEFMGTATVAPAQFEEVLGPAALLAARHRMNSLRPLIQGKPGDWYEPAPWVPPGVTHPPWFKKSAK